MYDDYKYANTRLRGTVVLHKRKPVYIIDINRKMEAMVATNFTTLDLSKKIPLSELNLTDFSLGFLNKDGHAFYLSRRTLRRDWRQGLRPNNVHSTNGGITIKDIADTLKQRYPSFKEALRTRNVNYSIAWCSEFALSGDTVVWRYEPVGKLEDGNILLGNDFKFLTSQLMEAVDGHCEVL